MNISSKEVIAARKQLRRLGTSVWQVRTQSNNKIIEAIIRSAIEEATMKAYEKGRSDAYNDIRQLHSGHL